MLLDKIIEMGTDNEPSPLTVVLRQCILLANQLKAPLLKTWAMQELNGYPSPKGRARIPHHKCWCFG